MSRMLWMAVVVAAVSLTVGSLTVVWLSTGSSAGTAEEAGARADGRETDEGEPDFDYLERETSVGWVFGRVMGVPGADRPMTGHGGFYGQQPLPPAGL